MYFLFVCFLCFIPLFVFSFVGFCFVCVRFVCFSTSVVTSFQFWKIICMRIIQFFFSLVPFMKEFLEFKLLSLNVRGIRSATKRRALFTWLNELWYDIIFLQETYSTVEVEDICRTQWRGNFFFAHGSNHSCGVIILVRSDLDFNPRTLHYN